jgi:hypothetical protein
LGVSRNPTDAGWDPRKGYRPSGGRTNNVLDALAFLVLRHHDASLGSSLWSALYYHSLSLAIRGRITGVIWQEVPLGDLGRLCCETTKG